MQIVIASSNKGKLSELSALLSPLGHKLISQDELAIPASPETGLSFVENALQKARATSKLAKLPCIADDSGLVVEALNGKPGIMSARFAGKDNDAQKNNEKLLATLKGVGNRNAYFYCCIVFISHSLDPTPKIAMGRWEGKITTKNYGFEGFGYDPIFFIPNLNRTAAELTVEEKNRISHRGQAAKSLCEQLRKK